MQKYFVIRDAVKKKLQIHAFYNGHHREMCPHVIGKKNGTRQGLFYQFGGTSESILGPADSPANWRCIPIDGLSDVHVVGGPWHSAPNYPGMQECVDDVDAKVDP